MPTGLNNIGNTCFINAALQCLFHIPQLNQFLNQYICTTTLLEEFNDLRKMIHQGHSSIIPTRFINVIRHISKEKKMDIFTSSAQNDLSEFLRFILNTIHTDMAHKIQIQIPPNLNDIDKKCFEIMQSTYSNDYSFIIEHFYGMSITIIDTPTKVLSIKPEPFFIMDLPIPSTDTVTLEHCLQLYIQHDTIEWKDDATNNYITASKKYGIWKMPNLLFIVFKRFDNDGKKNNKMIHIPFNFKMSNLQYTLLSVCNHYGNTQNGHYTSIVRTDNWYEINDDSVNIIHESKIITPNVYCVLFSKI
jgi:ubiquitin C-terminal hydrolase